MAYVEKSTNAITFVVPVLAVAIIFAILRQFIFVKPISFPSKSNSRSKFISNSNYKLHKSRNHNRHERKHSNFGFYNNNHSAQQNHENDNDNYDPNATDDNKTNISIGNDIEDDSQNPPLATREIVKKTTSSKKKDVAPPTADKSRANKNRPKPTGNEAAFKDRNTGRAANRSKPTDAAEEGKKGGKPNKYNTPTDRRSRSGKTDSEKKLKQAGWTDKDAKREAETEAAVDEDVDDEFAEDAQDEAEQGPAKKSLQEYLAELEASKQAVDGTTPPPSAPSVKSVDGEVLVKSKESFIPASVQKKEKAKSKKEKQTLDFDVNFADEVPPPRDGNRPRRGGAPRGRGGARGGFRRGGDNNAPSGAPKGGKKPFVKKASVLDDKNFPSLG